MSTYHPSHRRVRSGRTASGIRAGASGVFAAAAAIGLLTVPMPAQADPMLPLAPACQYGFTGSEGSVDVQQSNGAVVHLLTNGPFELVGVARATGTGGSGNDTMAGIVKGGLSGNQLAFTISWNNGPKGKYTGVVDDGGYVSGTTFDVVNPESRATWGLFERLQCVTPPAAPPPAPNIPPPPPNVPPPAPATAVLGAIVNGPATLQAGLSGTFVVTVSNSGGVKAPVELFIIFAKNLEQTGQIGAQGGFGCEVGQAAGINATLRCTGPQVEPGAKFDIVVQGVGRTPGQASCSRRSETIPTRRTSP
jgi:hypothetical protein